MINPNYVIYHDLIGFKVFIKRKSKSSEFKDIGTVINETKNMIITEKDNQIKKYIKKDHIFRLSMEDITVEFDGLKILGTPENRLRNLKKKRIVEK